jgi:hypothetical protein
MNPLINDSSIFFEKYKKKVFERGHQNPTEFKPGSLVIGEDYILHVTAMFGEGELDKLSIDEQFYYPICNKDEIRKILNPKNRYDYLLKIRADAIINNQRLNRVYLKRYENSIKQDWSLTSQFDDKLFNEFCDLLNHKQKQKCICLNSGFAFLVDPNGSCFKTPFGNMIVISEPLKYFLYYMNFFYLDFGDDISFQDQFQGLLIGIRTKLGTEALDFELDNRGELPTNIDNALKQTVNCQLKFIIGHEYAHHLLGHLDKGNLKLYATNQNTGLYDYKSKIYNYDQQLEFEADQYSIKLLMKNNFKDPNLLQSVYLFFLASDLYYCVLDYIFPSRTFYNTHPEPIDRILKINKHVNKNIRVKDNKLREMIELNKFWRNKLLTDYLPFKTEEFETYGSAYLPSFKNKELLDRIDY